MLVDPILPFFTIQFCLRYGDFIMECTLSGGQIRSAAFSPNDLRSSQLSIGFKNVLYDEKHTIITESFLK